MAENHNLPGRGMPPKTPGWVKAFFIVVLLLVLIVVAAHLMGLRFDHGAAVTSMASFASHSNPLLL